MKPYERVKLLRKTLNKNQESFGKAIGVSQGAITMIETGRTSLTQRNIKAICDTFGCSEQWLLEGIGEMFDQSVSAIPQEDSDILKFIEPDADPVRKKIFAAIGRSLDRMSDEDLKYLIEDLSEVIKQLEEK